MKLFNYDFSDDSLIETALTHSSYANEHSETCNERMEFLGDSVLSLSVSNYIYDKFPNLPEGRLSKIRASVVCEETLAKCAVKMDFGKYIKLGHGEEASGGRNRPSILSDAFESVIAAIYLDGGMKEASKFVLSFVVPEIKNHSVGFVFRDYKTKLQEIIQRNPGEKLNYVLVDESGPDHNKHFVVEVHLNSNVIGKGGGRSKKEAEQQAAREALELMGY